MAKKPLNQTDYIQRVITSLEEGGYAEGDFTPRNVKDCLEAAAQVSLENSTRRSGCIVYGLGKLRVKHKPATKKRKGTNPFTGEACVFKAKPESFVPKFIFKKAAKETVLKVAKKGK